jgi:hypothetical protein
MLHAIDEPTDTLVTVTYRLSRIILRYLVHAVIAANLTAARKTRVVGNIFDLDLQAIQGGEDYCGTGVIVMR